MLVLFLVSLVPGLLWLWFFARQDNYEREPLRLLLKSFLFGALMLGPAGFVESLFKGVLLNPTSPLARFLVIMVVVGLGEEFFKYLAVRLSVYESKEWNEIVDGIVYTVAAALGFSSLENLFYVASFGLQIAPLRALVSSLAHASFSGIFGYYLGLAKFQPARAFPLIATGLGVAGFLHGAFDYLLLSGVLSPLLAILVVAVLYRVLSIKIRQAKELSPFKP